jgi:hypothetical protein
MVALGIVKAEEPRRARTGVDQEPESVGAFVEVDEQVAGLLDDPGRRGDGR